MAEKSYETVLCFFFFFIIIISFSTISVSAQVCENTTGIFIPNSPYDNNRRLILSTLASNVTAHDGYFNSSMGLGPDRVYAMGMCAPGAEPNVCSQCIETASDGLLQNCPNQVDAFSWSGNETLCLVRYTNRSFSGLLVMESLGAIASNADTKLNQTYFDSVWTKLMFGMISNISSSSSAGNSRSKYYADEDDVVQLSDFRNISALMQCTPDVSFEDCDVCLRTNVINYQTCCRRKQGGVISRPSCFFRWELYPFIGASDLIYLQPSTPPSLTPSPVSKEPSPTVPSHVSKKDTRISGGVIAAIVVAVVVALILITLGVVIFKKRKQKQEIEIPTESIQFDLNTIEAATNNFFERNKLGEGGFGEVYKGMLMNGTEVAVKRLSKTSGQGEVEFKNEVIVVAKLQHRNLVRLLGFSLQGEEKLLVYEFVPNKSLNYFLFDPKKRTQLDWAVRRNIIWGITRGILYLHQDSRFKIIHRDLKASNILLDADMNPKIADFGMARIFGINQTVANTSKVVGTFGYMPPEYVANGQFSTKSDVYSFGVLILEIISGKKNSSFYQMEGLVNNLVTYAWTLWENKSLHELVDSGIREDCKSDEVNRYIHIGLLCVQENPADRPTMSTIHQMLTTSSIALPVPLPPGFFCSNEPRLTPLAQGLESGQSNSKSFTCSVDEATITDVTPR
ncbi:cysteine-rich RLK (RECEPTOR-like protein kinase) 18 [Raphanus sativus]|uniref:Cysteine-rich receptor-like protein kinase 18 isoform X2 n=1 Tax=Raphanus sativus TaxID=3726 RepID=A0A6J0KM23_RAPSA|nr:cysteine-rich receptor-like protein kinase 18 isoform X2 [Raphanus sativus]KAJ4880817.1 cysteine-rich RLK (RECEPTOR-like protein kinase) 18 [Raphanus sativus]